MCRDNRFTYQEREYCTENHKTEARKERQEEKANLHRARREFAYNARCRCYLQRRFRMKRDISSVSSYIYLPQAILEEFRLAFSTVAGHSAVVHPMEQTAFGWRLQNTHVNTCKMDQNILDAASTYSAQARTLHTSQHMQNIICLKYKTQSFQTKPKCKSIEKCRGKYDGIIVPRCIDRWI